MKEHRAFKSLVELSIAASDAELANTLQKMYGGDTVTLAVAAIRELLKENRRLQKYEDQSRRMGAYTNAMIATGRWPKPTRNSRRAAKKMIDAVMAEARAEGARR